MVLIGEEDPREDDDVVCRGVTGDLCQDGRGLEDSFVASLCV